MTESTPLITIGIPTYNRASSYLKQAIDSALNQTYKNIEIIVADNCSTDDTEALVGSFSDPRIHYHRHQVNIGPNNNFNFCLKQATGDYFLLFQDDDAIDEDFIESCMRGANYVTGLGIIRTGTRVIDSRGNVLLQCPNMVKDLPFEDFLLGWFRHKTAWYLCSTLFNTEKLREIGGFQSKHQLLQDGMAIAQLAAKYDRADVEGIKASFRKHGNEITFAVDVKDWVEDFLSFLELVCRLAPEKASILRSEGELFFSQLSYNRAMAVKLPFKRFLAYLAVYRRFGYRFMPPPAQHFLYENPLSSFIRRRRSLYRSSYPE